MQDGIVKAATVSKTVMGQDVVITMLPNGEILSAVANDIICVMDKGATLIDCLTSDVDSGRVSS
jgi:3-hydroxyisobutyrate dehydrogenase